MMTRLITFFILLSPLMIFSQVQPRCYNTIQHHEDQLRNNSKYRAFHKKIQAKKAAILKTRNPDCSNGPIIIPVAVHFESGIVPSAQEACAITLAEDQIASLNLEFNGNDPQNSSYGPLQNCFPGNPAIGNACIEFCIASEDHPTGYGLVNGEPAITFGTIDFTNINSGSSSVPFDANWAGYLNIYVGDLSGGLLGEAAGIPGAFTGEGVSVDDCTFGTGNIDCAGMNSSASCTSIYNEGNTLTHEVGHYLGLYHIWGDNFNCNGNQDQIDDTPDMSDNYSGYTACSDNTCTDLPETCSSADMYMNYMSYAADACMYMFTSDQADECQATAIASGFSTSTPAKCAPPVIPVANFEWSPDPAVICANNGILSFTDLSTGPPDSWSWTFSGAGVNISTSTDENPSVILNTSGNLTVGLTSSNAIGSSVAYSQTIPITILPSTDVTCQSCEYTIEMNDTYGDGWNGAELELIIEGVLYETLTLNDGHDSTLTFSITDQESIELIYDGGQYDNEVSFNLLDPYGFIAFAQGTNPPNGSLFTGDANCDAPSCTDGLKNGNETDIDCGGDCAPCPICGTSFFDTGGISGEYANNEDETWTLCPDLANSKLQLDFISFDVENHATCNYDNLSIYDGSNTSTLIGEYCGTSTPPTATSTTNDGCLTVVFESDSGVTGDGWEATITCIESCGTISNTNNTGTGSIMDAIDCSDAGDTIYFSMNIAGDTIILDNQEILINKSIYIFDINNETMTISTDNLQSLFTIISSDEVHLKGFNILQENPASNATGITNQGTLTLEDILITKPASGIHINNRGTLKLEGNTELKD